MVRNTLFTLILLTVFSINTLKAQAVIKFDKTSHDFGKVEEGTYPKTVFAFKNEGNEPLLLTDVRAGCGCTAPKWPKDSIMPGQGGEIEVVFNTRGRANRDFAHSVVVTTNYLESGRNKQLILYINGHVLGKGQGPPPYDFNISDPIIHFGYIPQGKNAVRKFEITNNGDSIIVISGLRLSCDNCMSVSYSPQTLMPKESAVFEVSYFSKSHDLRNFVENVQVITNIPEHLAINISLKGIVISGEVVSKEQYKEHQKRLKQAKKLKAD